MFSGKTTLARNIYESLGGDKLCSYLVHDDYYKDISHLSIEERAATNFDHPDSLDTDLLIEHVQALKEGKTIEVPNYDFSTHMRTDRRTKKLPKPVILIEGILIFSDSRLAQLLDCKVFVDTDPDIRFTRRLMRDTKERGRTVEQVIEQYHNTVRPMHNCYVEPSKESADIIVYGGTNKVSLNMIVSYLKEAIRGEDENKDKNK